MKRSLPVLVLAGLALSGLLAASSAWLADDAPDGLATVARDEGFADRESEHALGDSPVAGYRVKAVGDEGIATATAGLLGVFLTFCLAAGAIAAQRVRRRRITPRGGGS